MTEARESPAAVLFGEGRWDVAARRLTVRGQVAKLPWRVAECLRVLLEAGGAVVPKEDLQNQIWGGALVEESNLAQCITALRKALDPAPDGTSHIETVARVGYRIAVAIQTEQPVGSTAATAARRTPRWVLAAGVAVVVAATAAGGWLHYRRGTERQAELLAGQGLELIRRGNSADGERATPLFEQALKLRPNFALAHAGLAESLARYSKSTYEVASELARKAVREDPNCGECQAILGWILMTREWRWEEAGKKLARSVELDPESAQRRVWYANWLTIHKRLPEARAEAERAVQLDPLLAQARSTLAMTHYFSGQYEEAIREGEKALSLNPEHSPGYTWKLRGYLMLGDDLGAINTRAEEIGAWESRPQPYRAKWAANFRSVYASGGRLAVARAWIDDVEAGKPLDVHRYTRAVWFAWIGEFEAALVELEAAVQTRPYYVIYIAVDPAFAPLRTNPRFQKAVRSIGLTP
ncbi:MAG: tetratricopeptide repeat protein [Acidobacteria bacterium]|nr:tetratricopeptide repeat protein [Acidobacteriota bacterium]